jgi:hypothetical protein
LPLFSSALVLLLREVEVHARLDVILLEPIPVLAGELVPPAGLLEPALRTRGGDLDCFQ